MDRFKAAWACLMGDHVVYRANIIIHGGKWQSGDSIGGVVMHPKDFKYLEINTLNNQARGIACRYYTPETWANELANIQKIIEEREGVLPEWASKPR